MIPKDVVNLMEIEDAPGKFQRILFIRKEFVNDWPGFDFEEDEYCIRLFRSDKRSLGIDESRARARLFLNIYYERGNLISGYFRIDLEDINEDEIIIDLEMPYEKDSK